MIQWREALEWYFRGWFGAEEYPNTLDQALRESLGNRQNAELRFAYPVGAHDNDAVTFLALTDQEPLLIHFERPATTRISFPGSLAGGTYAEEVQVSDERTDIEITFGHERLGSASPLRIRFHQVPIPPPEANDLVKWDWHSGQKAAAETFQLVRETLRDWSKQPPQHLPRPK